MTRKQEKYLTYIDPGMEMNISRVTLEELKTMPMYKEKCKCKEPYGTEGLGFNKEIYNG